MKNTPTDRRTCAPFIPHATVNLSHSIDYRMFRHINKAVSSILATEMRGTKLNIERIKEGIRELKENQNSPPDNSNLTEEERNTKI